MKPVAHFILVDGEYQQLAEKYCESPDAIPLYDSPQTAWIMCSDRMPEFGRYYVQYDTDTGPQTCIASWREYDPCAPSDRRVQAWIPQHARCMSGLRKVTHWMPLPAAPEDAHE